MSEWRKGGHSCRLLSHLSIFFTLLSQPELLYKKERPMACRQSRVGVCDLKWPDKARSFFSYRF